MGLYERLIGTEQPKLPVHQFGASLWLWSRGVISRSTIIADYGLGASDEADLDWLKARYEEKTGASAEQYPLFVEKLLEVGESGLHGMDVKSNFTAEVENF